MKKKYPVVDIYQTGQNIKRIMKLRGVTVKEIQVFLGLSTPQSVYHWFEGRNLPTIDNLYALSELLRVPIDGLLRGSRQYKGALEDVEFYYRMVVYYKKVLLVWQVG